jgi:ribosome maturation factor RimP
VPIEEGVSVEDCARVSRDLSAVLDVEDVIPTAYTLEVSSPGLDRPLRHADDYSRFAGRRAKLVMREAVDGQMFFKGRLDGIEDSADRHEVTVMIVGDDGRSHRVPIGAITRANLEVEF